MATNPIPEEHSHIHNTLEEIIDLAKGLNTDQKNDWPILQKMNPMMNELEKMMDSFPSNAKALVHSSISEFHQMVKQPEEIGQDQIDLLMENIQDALQILEGR